MSETNTSQVMGQWESVKKNFAESILKMFPIQGRKNVLEMQEITFDESKAHPSDIRAQELAKHQEKTWGIPVYAKFVLKDKLTGQTINESKQKLAVMPRLTPRDTYIVSGGEWNSAYQWRLKSGIYSKVKENGQLETEFNLNGAGKDFAREARLKIPLDPEKKSFKLKYGTISIPLYSMLKADDMSDEDIKKEWGEDIFNANYKRNWQQDITKLYNSKLKKRGVVAESDTFDHIKIAVQKELHKAEVLPETTKLTLGKEIQNLSGKALLDGSMHILGVSQGKKPDDVYSVYFKHLLGLDDFIAEKFGGSKTAQAIKAKIRNTIDKREKVAQIIPNDLFSKPLSQVFIGNTLSQRPDQTNPIDILSSSSITTIKGPGGISSDHSIRNPMKVISQSHFAILDSILSPEGSETGVTLHLPIGAKKVGREARTLAYDLLHKKFDYINASQLHGDYSVLPDQISWKNGVPSAIDKKDKGLSDYQLGSIQSKTQVTALDPKTHEFVEIPFEKARYVLPSPRNLFSEATNLIPFLQNNQGNRTMTGAKQPSQGVPLKYREAPLIQVQSNDPNTSFEEFFGRRFSHQTPVNGTITDIVKDKLGNVDEVHIEDTTGKTHKVQLYNNFPLNDKKSFLHAEPVVKVGDKVTKGQQIADSNFSKSGTLAVGTNLKTAYMPYGALTFEDGVVISESGAKKLTSEHLHKTALELDPKNDKVSLSKFISHISTVGKKIKKDKLANLDENGIIKPGSIVRPGDLLVTAISKNTLEGQLGSMTSKLKGAYSAYKDKSLVWDHDYEGHVIKVVPKPGEKGYTVYVKTQEPAKVGDKICGRSGDKNIIGAIIPDHQMPRIVGETTPIDLLTAPSGVVSRINIGQLLEMGASKIAKKIGKPYVVTNFAPGVDYAEKLRQEMKEHGVSDTDKIFDPLLNKELEGAVLTGHKYIIKQKHQVEKKESVRGLDQALAGKYSVNFDPQRGKGEGAQAISPLDFYALLAHGARANLKEMSSYKAELQHDSSTGMLTDSDFWNRVMLGIPLQPPKPTFAYRKFEGYLTGLGLNLKKDGHSTVLTPLTDKGVLALSNGEIKEADQTRGKDDKEIPGGLFDLRILGGLPNQPGKGRNWGHVSLAEPFPNPLYCGSVHLPGPAPVLSGLSFANFDKVVKGQMTTLVNGKEMTGGKAIAELLKKIDVKKDFEKIKAQLPTLKGSELNKANKKAKFLQALDRLNLRPEEAYIMNHVPILPPMFRPITVLPDGSSTSADINTLYKNLILLNNGLKEKDMLKNFPEKEQKLREDVYDALKATTGLGKVPSYDGNKALKGILQTVAGDSPKTGFFQSKIMKRRQELSMRSTIIPDPNMSIDEVALPKAGAYELYKPFIIRELIRSGKDILEANKEVKEGTAIAWRALDNAIKDRPVLVKRDPVLHKYNVMAYRPKLIEGNAIGLHPLNCGLGNADFDGNCYIGSTKIHVEISNKNWNNTSVDNLEHFLQEKYQMKFNETTQLVAQNRNGALITLQIKDLPRLEEGKILDRNGAWIYPVPEGISVWSYDHKTNRPIFSPVTGITVEDNCPTVNVETRKFSVTASSNESLCVYDHKTEEVVDICPKDAIGRLCPVMAQIPSFGEYGNTEVGWLIGAFVSDGSIAGNTVHYSKVSKEHRDRFYSALGYLQASPIVRHTYEELHGEENAIQGQSIKDHFSRLEKPVVDLFRSCYSNEEVEGRSCLRKKLPSQLEDFSREMLLGILSGLFDGDGSLSISHSKRKAQPIANFATSSIYLVDSIKRLCKLLSIRISVSKTEPKEGRLQKHTSYTISFSIIDLYNYVNELSVIGERKREVLALLASEKRDDGTDIVPVPTFVMQLITTKSGPMNGHPSFAAFNTIKNSRKAGFYVSRDIAEMIISVLVNANVPNLERWINLVRAKNVHWDAVRSVTENKKETVYDLVVPETKVFAVNGGLVVWDTMAVHLPLTEQARQEAIDKMLPSKNLFSATNYGIMHAPDQESIIGLNNLSLWGAKKERNYKSLDDLVKSESHLNDVVNVKIDGQVKETTKGRALLVQSAPQDMDHDKLLHDPSFLLKKSSIHKMLETFAKKDPKGYPVLVDDWRRKGNDRAHEMGFSFNLSDLKPFKEKRDAILAPYHQKAAHIRKSKDGIEEQDNKIVTLYNEATEHLDKELAKDYAAANNNMYKMVDTKARGSMAQFRQTVIAPMLLVDANNRVIPNPVTNSYSEGLNVAQYWTTLHGARKGTLQRAQSTALPGAMAKEIVNLNIATPIVKHDCGDVHGTHINLVDNKGHNEIDVTDRYLAKDIGEFKRDTLITPEVFAKMRQQNINTISVRSPISCNVPQGICSRCFGNNENGREHEIGTNIGVIASQALSEPAVQLAMDCSADGNLVSVRLNGRTLTLTFEQLWSIVGGFVSEDGDIETKMPMNLEVWDHNKWVEVRTFQRHKPDSVMVIARTESGRSFVVKGSHPSWARKEVTECPSCKTKDSPSYWAHYTNDLKTIVRCNLCSHQFTISRDLYDNQIEKIVAAKDLKSLYVPVSPQIVDEGFFSNIPPYIMGFFLAEGNLKRTKVKNEIVEGKTTKRVTPSVCEWRHLMIVFTQNEGPTRERIKAELTKHGLPFSEPANKTITVSNIPLMKEFYQLGISSSKKQLPIGFLGASTEWKLDFLAGLLDGDGCIEGQDRMALDTTSWHLASQVQELVRSIGGKSYLYKTTNKELTRHQGFRLTIRLPYQLNSVKNFPIWTGILENYGSYEKIIDVKEILYDGWTYDFSTESKSYTTCGITTHNSFHSGGTAMSRGGGSTSRLERLGQLLNLPKTLPYSATLSKIDGKVHSISKTSTGGHEILIGREKDVHKHYVPSSLDLKVEVGQEIERGDPISSGPINPHQLLQLKDMGAVRKYLTTEMGDMYKDVGGVRRRNVEVVVRNLTNLTEVVDSGKSDHLAGDILPTSIVEAHNRMAKEKDDKILHRPILRGIKESALLKSEDYLSRMNFQRIQNTLIEGAGKMWHTTPRSLDPLSSWSNSSIDIQKDKNDAKY